MPICIYHKLSQRVDNYNLNAILSQQLCTAAIYKKTRFEIGKHNPRESVAYD